MNETDITNYLSNPNTTALNGFLFRINYSHLNTTVSSEILPEEITKINSQYNPIYFNLLLKISHLLGTTSNLKTLFIVDYEAVKEIFLKKFETKIFNFTPTGQLIILANTCIIDIDKIDESIFEIKILSLDNSTISNLKSEVNTLHTAHNSIFTEPSDTSCTNTKINELYIQLLLNLLMEDYHSFSSCYSLFSGLNQQIKNILFGLIKKSNHSLHLNEDSLYIGTIALISLLTENRLAYIYEIENGSYNDDKTLGGLIQDLNNQGYLSGIHTPLNNFKIIRNNLIHYHRRTFNLYNSFIESIKYLGQFLIWCKNNGRL